MRIISLYTESDVKKYLRLNKFEILSLFIRNQVVCNFYSDIFERIYLFSNFLIVGITKDEIDVILSGKYISEGCETYLYISVFAVRSKDEITFNYWAPFQALVESLLDNNIYKLTFTFYHYQNSLVKFLNILNEFKIAEKIPVNIIKKNILQDILSGFFSDTNVTLDFLNDENSDINALEVDIQKPRFESYSIDRKIHHNESLVYKRFLRSYNKIIQENNINFIEPNSNIKNLVFIHFNNTLNKKNNKMKYSSNQYIKFLKICKNLSFVLQENIRLISFSDFEKISFSFDFNLTAFIFISEKKHYKHIYKFSEGKNVNLYNYDLDQDRILLKKIKHRVNQLISTPNFYSYFFKKKMILLPINNLENGFLDSFGLSNFSIDILNAKSNLLGKILENYENI